MISIRHRVVALCDMDAFFASIEERDNPKLTNRPIGVGSNDRRSVIATANYAARKFGVKSAMPTYQAMELCPDLIIIPPNFQKYKEASKLFEQILREASDIVEVVSIDEAYIDLTHNNIDDNDYLKAAQWIKDQVVSRIGVTCSIGISHSKSIAKMASGINKPDGITFIKEENIDQFLLKLPVGEFRGVGGKTKSVLESNQIFNGHDLRAQSIEQLTNWFGDKRARWIHNMVRGIDDREVISEQEERKSINLSQTYQNDITNGAATAFKIWDISQQLSQKVKRYKLEPRTITIRIKYSDFKLTTRSLTSGAVILDDKLIYKLAMKLIKQKALEKPVRLFGVGLSNFVDQNFKLW